MFRNLQNQGEDLDFSRKISKQYKLREKINTICNSFLIATSLGFCLYEANGISQKNPHPQFYKHKQDIKQEIIISSNPNKTNFNYGLLGISGFYLFILNYGYIHQRNKKWMKNKISKLKAQNSDLEKELNDSF